MAVGLARRKRNQAWGTIRQRRGTVVTSEGRMQIVFAGTEQETERVAAALRKAGYNATTAWLRSGSGTRRGWQREWSGRRV